MSVKCAAETLLTKCFKRHAELHFITRQRGFILQLELRKEKKRKEKKRKEKLLIKKQSWSEYSSVRSFFLQIDQCVSFQYLCSEQSEVHSQTCFLSLILHKESNLKYSCDINSHRSDIFKDK